MANQNHYALLIDDESDDPSALFERAGAASRAAGAAKEAKKTAPPPVAKLPTKPAPPARAVKESQSESGRGRIRGGRTGGRSNFGSRDNRFSEGPFSRPPREGGFQGSEPNDRSFSNSRGGFASTSTPLKGESSFGIEERIGSNDLGSGQGRGRSRGRGRGYGSFGDGEERPRQREYDRRSGTGRGIELKREGSGLGNWGIEIDKQSLLDNADPHGEEEKPSLPPETTRKAAEDTQQEREDAEKQDEEEKEMTLEEYEKLLSEKRKNIEALKVKERKATLDKDFASMKLVEKKSEEESFLKVGGADKGKKKESMEKDERSKKPLSINEFLRPVEGEGYFSPSGRRGRGSRGYGERGGFRGGFGAGYSAREATAPSIEDPSHFPTLGGK